MVWDVFAWLAFQFMCVCALLRSQVVYAIRSSDEILFMHVPALQALYRSRSNWNWHCLVVYFPDVSLWWFWNVRCLTLISGAPKYPRMKPRFGRPPRFCQPSSGSNEVSSFLGINLVGAFVGKWLRNVFFLQLFPSVSCSMSCSLYVHSICAF